ncbi:MAG TPA: universal stress protein [Bacillota bacterium]|nr:universal stress protein [Bacillota bacterium]
MLCSRILVAFDGSDLGKKALEKAIELAKSNPLIEIDVVHVVSFPVIMGEFVISEENLQESAIQHGKEVLDQAKELLTKIPNTSHTYVMEGHAPTVLLEHARVYSCDLIVMGSRGLSGFREFFLGSVSHNVAQHSPIPVFIVK